MSPSGILETSLYVADISRSERFYESVLGLETIEAGERLRAMKIGDRQILLLCKKGASAGLNPGAHDGAGRLHLALAIGKSDLPGWKVRLGDFGVEIEEEHEWELGGHSLYFRDPDGHLIELATPGVWTIY